jgi:hypothetical protein
MNITKGNLEFLLPEILDDEGNFPFRQFSVEVVSPPGTNITFSIFSQPKKVGLELDTRLRLNQDYATILAEFPMGARFALAVNIVDSEYVLSSPTLFFISFWVD